MRSKIILSSALFAFIASLFPIDHFFFKKNRSFSLRLIHTSLPNQEEFALPPATSEQLRCLDTILEQPFYYLGKGAHCFAFVSQDQRYVIKFHRFASHMRPLPWLSHHLLSYCFGTKRQKIKEYNFQRLHYHFANYKQSFLNLKEESGLLFVHINRTDTLHRFVTIVDPLGVKHQVCLDDVTCIVQRKAELIYPTLDLLCAKGRLDDAKTILSSILTLLVECCKKGYVDEDPILRRNYGLVNLNAIHIDIGDLILREGIENRENYIPYIKEVTEPLRKRLEAEHPDLLPHYLQEVAAL